VPIFTEIRPVGAAKMHADRQAGERTDVHDERYCM